MHSVPNDDPVSIAEHLAVSGVLIENLVTSEVVLQDLTRQITTWVELHHKPEGGFISIGGEESNHVGMFQLTSLIQLNLENLGVGLFQINGFDGTNVAVLLALRTKDFTETTHA